MEFLIDPQNDFENLPQDIKLYVEQMFKIMKKFKFKLKENIELHGQNFDKLFIVNDIFI